MQHGGLVRGADQQRVDGALVRLLPAVEGAHAVRVYVLGSQSAEAFSWPDGTLFIGRGLIRALSDDELAAALAHELGHLSNGGHLQGVASLHRARTRPDLEAVADARGVEILAAAGIDGAAMASMLVKVQNDLPNAARSSHDIGRRIGMLRAAANQR